MMIFTTGESLKVTLWDLKQEFQFYCLIARKLTGLARQHREHKETLEGAGRKGRLLFPDRSPVDMLVMSNMGTCLFVIPF